MPTNHIKLSGRLLYIEPPKPGRWIYFKGRLGGRKFSIQIYAIGDVADQLRTNFQIGDSILVTGCLSLSPEGQFQIAVKKIELQEPRPRISATHHMEIPTGGNN